MNCALVIFLNALTVHFKLANNWTLHSKAFKATFEEASFEARTDGYLDCRGHAQVIIEVKPVMPRPEYLIVHNMRLPPLLR